jgi:L-methionine (R)-S-oxide reductase
VLKQNAYGKLSDPFAFHRQKRKERRRPPSPWFLARCHRMDAGQHEGADRSKGRVSYRIERINNRDPRNAAPFVATVTSANVRHFRKTFRRVFSVNCSEERTNIVCEAAVTRLHEELLREFQEWSRTASTPKALMEHISQRLHEKMTKYNWVGFYLVDPADSGFLVVGPFVGSFTPNARIPLNKGLCGAAATSEEVVVVDDVQKDSRYLSGSTMVKSEIVVPIIVNKVVAELDIESYFPSTFNQSERQFVEACAAVVGRHLAGL